MHLGTGKVTLLLREWTQMTSARLAHVSSTGWKVWWIGSTPCRISSPSRLVRDHSCGEQEEQERVDMCKTSDMPSLLPHPTGKTVKRQTPDSRVGETDSISWWLTEPHCKVFRETADIFCSQSPTGFNPTPKSRWKAVTFSNILNHTHFLAISPLHAISVPKPSVSYWLGRYNGSRIEQIEECLLLGWGGILKFTLLVHWLHLYNFYKKAALENKLSKKIKLN